VATLDTDETSKYVPWLTCSSKSSKAAAAGAMATAAAAQTAAGKAEQRGQLEGRLLVQPHTLSHNIMSHDTGQHDSS
jgi:hypothetical protein